MQYNSFLGEAGCWGLLLSDCTEQERIGVLSAPVPVLKPSYFPFCGPRILLPTGLCQLLEIRKLRVRLLGSSCQSWYIRCVVQTLCSLGKNWERRVLSHLPGAVLETEFTAKVGLSFSYPFLNGNFLSHLVYRSLLTSFWIFPGGNWSVRSCLFGSSVGGERVLSLLFCHLADVSNSLIVVRR